MEPKHTKRESLTKFLLLLRYQRQGLVVSDEHQRITAAEAEGAIRIAQSDTVKSQSKEIEVLDQRINELETKEQKIFDAYYADQIAMYALGAQIKAVKIDRKAAQERRKKVKKVHGAYPVPGRFAGK